MERAYRLAKENELLSGEYRFNVKYSLAEFFIRRAAEEGLKLSISVNMYAYDCLNPKEPEIKAEGAIHRCDMDDVEELVTFLEMFHNEIGIDRKDVLGYRADAELFIRSGNMFFWKDNQGNVYMPSESQEALCRKPCLSGDNESERSRLCSNALHRCGLCGFQFML